MSVSTNPLIVFPGRSLTHHIHGRHNDGEEDNREVVLYLATSRLAEICLPDVKDILQAIDGLCSRIDIHTIQDPVQVLADILSGTLLEDVGKIRVQKLVFIVCRKVSIA